MAQSNDRNNRWTDRLDDGMPAVAVLVSGLSIMGLEILAGRMLAPEFGNTIYTWGSIIGVFMAALSLGYYVGGKRAERHASFNSLTSIMLQAALFVAFLLLFHDSLIHLGAALPVPVRYAALIPITLLFGPPTVLLGLISPYAAELSQKNNTGEASGNVFAVGTIGSIAGAFVTTFVLIPTFSTAVIALLFGILLVIGAVVVSPRSVTSKHIAYPLLVLVLLLGTFGTHSTGFSVGENTIHHTQTPYQQLKVVEDNGVRTMYLNGQPQSAMDVNNRSRHVFGYTKYFHMPFLIRNEQQDPIDNVLFIGGGGFTGPKRFVQTYDDVQVDVVEIDPDVIAAAEQYFGVNNLSEAERNRIDIHQMDGRQYLEETDETYDLIVLDAYRKGSVPFHLTTKEFMQLAHRKTDDDGMVFANLLSTTSGSGSKFYKAQYKTMNQVYPAVYTFPTSHTSFTQNIELIATKQPRLSKTELVERNAQRDIGIDLRQAISFYQEPPETKDAPVLTDERAPVDKLLDPLIGTKYVIEE